MRYAIQNTDSTFKIDAIGGLFPKTSFLSGGPSQEWLTENNVYPVVDMVNQSGTQQQVPTDPYLENGHVYTVKLQDLSLDAVKLAQISTLRLAYESAIIQDVTYTSTSGQTKTFQADKGSVDYLQNSLAGCQLAQATPPGFFWVSSDNTQVPFTISDLQGLAAAIFNQGLEAFAHLQTLKSKVLSAKTLSAVQAIAW